MSSISLRLSGPSLRTSSSGRLTWPMSWMSPPIAAWTERSSSQPMCDASVCAYRATRPPWPTCRGSFDSIALMSTRIVSIIASESWRARLGDRHRRGGRRGLEHGRLAEVITTPQLGDVRLPTVGRVGPTLGRAGDDHVERLSDLTLLQDDLAAAVGRARGRAGDRGDV